MPRDLRLAYMKRGKRLSFLVQIDDQQEEIEAYEGETIATALLASGKQNLRRTRKNGKPRNIFCAVGSCYDCVMEVNSQPFVRACYTLVEPGMVVRITEQ